MGAKPVEQELGGLAGVGFQEAGRGEALEVGETLGVLGEEDQAVGGKAGVVFPGEGDLATDDGLDTLGRAGLAELHGAEEIAAIGDGDGGHAGVCGQGSDLVGLDGAFAQRIAGVDAQVDEVGVRHLGVLDASRGARVAERKEGFFFF